jgi:hypothetical protein
MTGYELFKRFAFERLAHTIVKMRKITANIVVGLVVSIALIAGSFYLSLKGSHRLIDTSDKVVAITDSSIAKQTDSISKYYDKEIAFYRSQSARTKEDRRYRDSIVNALQQTKDSKIQLAESKISDKSANKENKIQENSFAFAVMVFFLEFIILIGVAFSAYYEWTSYSDMKKILMTPKFKQLELNMNLLKLYYQNGRKKEQDSVIAKSKLVALVKAAKLQVTLSEVNSFVAMCSELEIVTGTRNRKVYNVDYEKAKNLLEINQGE